MGEFIDDQVGLLLDRLEEHGVAENTFVVFTSDHGSFLTAPKMHDKGPAMYEDIYNVPLIAHGLGESGHVEDRFVSLLDLGPTFLDIAGTPVPPTFDGRSLRELYGGMRTTNGSPSRRTGASPSLRSSTGISSSTNSG